MIPLSPRQAAVVTLLAAGEPYKEIARRLGISVDAVGAHAHRAAVKLGVRPRWRAALGVKKLTARKASAASIALFTEEDERRSDRVA